MPVDTYGTGYLEEVFNPLEFRKKIDQTIEAIEKSKLSFDAIAFRGSSGAACAYPISYMTGRSLIHVRKPTENAHSSRLIEGNPMQVVKNYIIVDDFIATGATINCIMECLTPTCVGIFLFNGSYRWPTYRGGGEDITEQQIPVYSLGWRS